MIGIVAPTAAGRAHAARLATAWPDEVRVFDGPVHSQLDAAWANNDVVVCFLATGATVRLIAPLLADKHTDPGVVCVDEAGRFAVALTGGHDGGANDAARRIAALLGAEPVITTATDSVGLPPLDGFGADLGFRLADPAPVARVTRAMLDGAGVTVVSDATWPVPPLPAGADPAQPDDDTTQPVPSLSGAGSVRLVVSDRTDAVGDLLYRPPSLVVGVGASRGVTAEAVAAVVDAALATGGLDRASVRALATVDVKADEAGILAFAEDQGWPVLTFPADDLAAEDVPTPSEVVRAAVGTPSVAEAAALRAARDAGRDASLVVAKRVTPTATAAVARLVPRGRLTIVGIGPGAEDLRTPRATAALRRASVVVGLDQYVDQVRHLLSPGARIVESVLGEESKRAREAVELATEGHAVVLIGSGDAGLYAMASPALELAGADVDVEAVPGVTAALAASALLGAPLGHDHAYVSLSDLHTPWPVIVERLRAVAGADLVACLYNPRSKARTAQFAEALAILGKHRPPETPVGVVRDASRAGQRVHLTTLAALTADPSIVDMRSVVLVGSSRSRLVAGRMVTPREYTWLS
ncbi:precorrin-3B C(17)-methyltransferase [Asanoa ishikariensis]|uniref:Cobalt-precorrin 5A hydrolase / precorrin-3B C17-methyltransferase n=1 Tax=Asanoa ishikariensis TaxID=137265 RepID=A0A1H3RZE5_9ACTN|nr:precorrin-3B C(17)-methyltransferase [Asanoa ishikariensis]GIF66652.1 precorrin-3B C(17)-methyltransferase [Asanoa ishikariensis]SDZ31116.1 cobalt-precorrin 5A hydrolase / precorrin-3B C17-methyltransferase [Asanoa ishikariensis]